jgi:hypothetical protein
MTAFSCYLFEDSSAVICSSNDHHLVDRIYVSPSGALMIVEKNRAKIKFLTCSLPQTFHNSAKLLLDFRVRNVRLNLFFPDNLLDQAADLMKV